MKLLVRNLSRNTTEDHLIRLFEEFGKVTACNLVLDDATGRSKGFGFIEMSNDTDAKDAISNLNGRDFHGARIRVKKASKRAHRTAAPGSPPPPRRGR